MPCFLTVVAWLPGNAAADLPSAVPQFWTGQNLTWSVLARVDGITYSLFGVPQPNKDITPALVSSGEYTASRTTFVLAAGAAEIVLDFLSPISHDDYVRQSLPFSYLTVSVSGLNNGTPSVQIYSDVDNSWTGHFGLTKTQWTYATTAENTAFFTMTPHDAVIYSEADDMAQWGSAVYATRPSATHMTAQVGDMASVRAEFIANGSLLSSQSWAPGGVFAYSHDIGTIDDSVTQHNLTFIIGHVRSQAINYLGSARTQYWQSLCPNISCIVDHTFNDFDAADKGSREFDTSLDGEAKLVGGLNYSHIVTLSARQVLGSIDITIPYDTLDTNDIMMFMKEISSDGNVNTIDVICPAAPFFYSLNPEYIRLLLEPVVQYIASGKWPRDYAIHDIGSSYPNATGHNNGQAENMPVEECGNILILAYMYQKASNNSGWAKGYNSVFRTYADYLVVNGLYPTTQLSTDDGAGSRANQTNLAIKAAVALNAYGTMSGQANYSNTGKQFAHTLYKQDVGVDSARTHFTLIEGDASSWTMAFNLYPDVLLDLHTFPSTAYAMQSSYYAQVHDTGGVPLDSENDWGKTDWMIWAAATAMAPDVTQNGTRDIFVDDVHGFLTNGLNDVPFSDKYFVRSDGEDVQGVYDGYKARPVVGGHFALLALQGPSLFD